MMRPATLYFLFTIVLLNFMSCKVFDNSSANLNKTAWIHGTKNCKENTDPPYKLFNLIITPGF